ncbi:MAG: CDP-alcohol phosphatidyltransferase family protein, partial [Candidatus Marinimicrobia bacterium]|nr:CDP-alcohol phosphatidyltransferase family protein [Candidatus Neomarinimicrobiota bacterium]
MKIKKPIKKDHIPSLFTLLNMFLGFLSIISAIEGFYLRAAYLIIAASIFDGMDGKLARWIQAPSKFGSELDS